MGIDKIRNIGLDKLVTQVYDFDSLTTDELMCKFAQKINIIIDHLKYIDDRCYNSDKAMEEKLQYLLGQGLEEQVARRLLELINNGTIGEIINETLLKNINDQLQQNKNEILKIKDYTLKNKKFKPNFKHNLYWSEKTELEWENDLLVFKKCGIKKAVLVVMIEKDSDNTFRVENNFENYIKFLNDNHVKYGITHVDIKIHFNFNKQVVMDYGRFDFIPIYERLVEQIVKYVHDNISNSIIVENVTYLNETWFYFRTWKLGEDWVEDNFTQTKYHPFWDNLKTIVNKYGFKNSVCFAGVKDYITASSYLLNTLDFIGINTYPSLSQSFEKTTVEQCIESWKCHDIYNQIKEIRNSFPNKPIFITETGCQDWWASLIRTESYNMDNRYRVASHGLTTYLMMKSFFEVFNDLIDEVWWWFEVKQSNYDKNIAMIKEYIGGEY